MIVDSKEASELLNNNQVIAVPTETVYGLAALFNSEAAIEKIYEIKGRPKKKALTVNVQSFEQIEPYLISKSYYAKVLADQFWPGPLTLVLEIKPSSILPCVTAGTSYCGFRIPNQKELLDLISQVGPIVLPSANPSSQPSAKSQQEVENYFGKDFPVLGGSGCSVGIESTVVMVLENEIKILREGAIKSLDLYALISEKSTTEISCLN